MYAVSTAWATAQNHFLAPEGFVELSCYVPELKKTLVYTKNDLMSFTHQQTGSLVTGELPKNHIEFTLDNSDGKWNPSNPRGLERYLTERLKIVLRYGFNINGSVHWIPGGVFYLSEWRTSQNGLEATFKARDLLEYMIDKPYTGGVSGTLYEIAMRAIGEANLSLVSDDPNAVLGTMVLGQAMLGVEKQAGKARTTTTVVETPVGGVRLCDELKNYSVGDIAYDGNETIAVILQKCANAAGCVMYQDRNGIFTIGKLSYDDTGYVIKQRLAYSYPEISYSRPMKEVSVTYSGDAVAIYRFGTSGETQTLNNNFIANEGQAIEVAEWVCDSLRSRQQISGEFRGDPRIDLFDVVKIESKYGEISGVVLTDVKYSFAGAFHVTYSGYVRGSGVAVVVYCGELFAGEGA